MEAVAEPVSKPTNKRRYRTVAERRSIVEESLVPGASVSKVARSHGVNANQVFGWRKMYQEGLLSCSNARRRRRSATPRTSDHTEADPIAVRLLPVTVAAESKPAPEPHVIPSNQLTHDSATGAIELTLPKARIRITGAVDTTVLRTLLESLTS